jgi:hypothetical protein
MAVLGLFKPSKEWAEPINKSMAGAPWGWCSSEVLRLECGQVVARPLELRAAVPWQIA